VKENLQELLIKDLDHSRFGRLKDIDDVVVRATDAIEAYRKEAPDLFTFGTDYITKSIGFVDEQFGKRMVLVLKHARLFKSFRILFES
jgi:putative GTP pyrophosphokinase